MLSKELAVKKRHGNYGARWTLKALDKITSGRGVLGK